MAEGKSVRCAVYTRKSSDEGLEQSFNSLHAQREACEAYILSQKHEGWQLVPTAYDDGGFSGGSMERPALKALLDDLDHGLVDIIVVYKVDRLTRSLADFAKMVELFDARSASFVSVTQAFNTTSSMGRLTLNVLLSFAQFEREVTGERIRDKIAASKAKGMWMGGVVPLGYDWVNKSLLINEAEAEQVRTLYRLYLKLKAVDAVAAKANAIGIKSKARANKAGKPFGGVKLSRGSIYKILENPIYVGEIAHRDKVHAGLHEPIMDRKLFDAVQTLLAANRKKKLGSVTAAVSAPLAGLVWRDTGERMGSTHTSKGGRRYRYYADDRGRIPADELEVVVLDSVADRISDEKSLARLLPDLSIYSEKLRVAAAQVASDLTCQVPATQRATALKLIERVVVAETKLIITIRLDAFGAVGSVEVTIAATVGHCRARLSLVVPGIAHRAPDQALVAFVARARAWFAELADGTSATMAAVATRHGVTSAYVRQSIGAAFLAPDIVEDIVLGRQPAALTIAALKELLPLPTDWHAQRATIAALK